nr:SpoIIE family protein phosphatase [uncultured Actinoplanes sp.]
MGDDEVTSVIRRLLAVIPAGCSWLLPVTTGEGVVSDFRVAAASGRRHDLYHRGTSRIDQLLSELYPSIVGGRLWQVYLDVLRTGDPVEVTGFRYEEKRAGVVAESLFDVSVSPVLGGLLVTWLRVDEDRRRAEKTELLGNLGWSEYDLLTGANEWSPGIYRIFERDPALGPLSRAEQAAALLSEDRGVAETAWQTLDSGAASDVTARFRVGGKVKHLRILSDVVADATGRPLKINAVVQDVTAREDSRTAIDRLRDQLRTREMTALAEHRLAGQLQHMIQPVPREPFELPGLLVRAGYLPAESTIQVGGDWYHAQPLPDGRVLLAVGDMAGHGLEAASGMAHLRFSLIAWLSIGIDEPATLLAHLNRLCVRLGLTGTAILGVYDPGPRTLTWGRAGHSPPLLARCGCAHALPLPPGLLLGAEEAAGYATLTEQLKPGDLLLLYTDGLVERRGGPPLLPEITALMAEASARDSLAHLVTGLQHPSPDDDTCTLAIRVGQPVTGAW